MNNEYKNDGNFTNNNINICYQNCIFINTVNIIQ